MQKAPPKAIHPDDLNKAKKEEHAADVILKCDHVATPPEVLQFVVDDHMTQVVQETGSAYETEFKSSLVMMEAPKRFFEFPLATILRPNSVSAETEAELKALEMPFHSSHEKTDVLTAIESLMERLAGSSVLQQDVTLVADELITNAIYNAKFEKAGVHVSRKEDVVLDKDKACRLLVGTTDDRMVLVCEDLFGSLNILKVIARIKKCYDDGAASAISWKEGGAGIGSYMIFQNSISMYYAVDEDERTMIACVFPLGRGSKARLNTPKNIHILNLKAGRKK